MNFIWRVLVFCITISIFFSGIALTASDTVSASTYRGFEYRLIENDTAVEIVGYLGPGGEVEIPSTINGWDVVSIGEGSFYHCTILESIHIPESVRSIGDHAFMACTDLNFIEIPANVTYIGEGAFQKCTSLSDVVLPEGITAIEAITFYGCTSLTEITIPCSVTTIEPMAFAHCTSLTSMNFLGLSAPTICESWLYDTSSDLVGHAYEGSDLPIPGEYFHGLKMGDILPVPSTKEGLIFLDFIYRLIANDTAVEITGYFGPGGEIEIPSVIEGREVVSIGNRSFYRCTGVTSIIIPENVTNIGDRSFYSCIDMSSIVIPANVTHIGKYAFYKCTSLRNVTIPEGVSTIEMATFYGCASLTEITIPRGVTTIGSIAFAYCTSLTSMNFLGPLAPTIICDSWIHGASANLTGHAHKVSNFPKPGGDFYGLTMGDIIPVYSLKEELRPYLTVIIVPVLIIAFVLAWVMKRKGKKGDADGKGPFKS